MTDCDHRERLVNVDLPMCRRVIGVVDVTLFADMAEDIAGRNENGDIESLAEIECAGLGLVRHAADGTREVMGSIIFCPASCPEFVILEPLQR